MCSRAGEITHTLYTLCGDRIKDILPALGSHDPMESPALEKFFGPIPQHLFRVHDWRNDVVQIGTVPAAFVSQATLWTSARLRLNGSGNQRRARR